MSDIDLYRTRILPADDDTLRVLRTIRDQTDWTKHNKHIQDVLYAYAYAQIPRRYWDYNLNYLPDCQAVRDVRKYINCLKRFVRREHFGLALFGPPGCGKTFLASFIAREAVQLGIRTWFYDVARYTEDTMTSFDDEEAKKRLKTIILKPELLIIDNVGSGWFKGVRPVMETKTEQLLRMRQNRGATLFTFVGASIHWKARANKDDATNFQERESNMLPDRIISLMKEMMRPIQLEGLDLRDKVGQRIWDSVEP